MVLVVYSKAVQCWPELGSVSLCRMNAGVGVQVLRDSIFSDGYLISKSIVRTEEDLRPSTENCSPEVRQSSLPFQLESHFLLVSQFANVLSLNLFSLSIMDHYKQKNSMFLPSHQNDHFNAFLRNPDSSSADPLLPP